MAVPSLPTNLASGAVLTETWVDASRAMHAWQRDGRPIFKGYMWDGDVGQPNTIATSTTTTLGVGNAGSFAQLSGMGTNPYINVGSFTTQGSDADPESLVVPEAGIYWVGYSAGFGVNATGGRATGLVVDGAAARGADMGVEAIATNTTTLNTSTILDLASGAQIDLQVWQDSGTGLTVTAYISVVWMQST